MKKITLSVLVAMLGAGLVACDNKGNSSAGGSSAPATASSALAASEPVKEASSNASDMPGKGIAVQPVQSTQAEEMFQTLVVSDALKALGYEVKPPKLVDYSAGYMAVANGDATFMACSWDPLQKEMYDNAGGDAKFYREGKYIDNNVLGYLIDKKTADQYHITNLSQFKDPKIAKLFDADGSGKASLIGCQAGWGCERAINHQVKAYELTGTVNVKQGQYAALMADTIARYKEGKPVFYYTWTPYWVSAQLVPGKDVVWLEVPFSANPENKDTKMANGKNYGSAINTQRIAANKKWAQDNPAAAKLFAIAQMPLEDVNAENLLIHQGEASPEQIEKHAQNWIKSHQSVFDDWIKQARAAAKK